MCSCRIGFTRHIISVTCFSDEIINIPNIGDIQYKLRLAKIYVQKDQQLTRTELIIYCIFYRSTTSGHTTSESTHDSMISTFRYRKIF